MRHYSKLSKKKAQKLFDRLAGEVRDTLHWGYPNIKFMQRVAIIKCRLMRIRFKEVAGAPDTWDDMIATGRQMYHRDDM